MDMSAWRGNTRDDNLTSPSLLRTVGGAAHPENNHDVDAAREDDNYERLERLQHDRAHEDPSE